MNNTESITKSKEELKEFDIPLIDKKVSQTKKANEKEKKVEVNQLSAEAKLTDINIKWKDYQRENQQLTSQINNLEREVDNFCQQKTVQITNFLQEIKLLQKKVAEYSKEKGAWLNLLRAYWSREVNIIQFANQIAEGVSPEEREEIINQLQTLNKQNGKVEKAYKKKPEVKKSNKKFWVISISILLVAVTAILGGGAWFITQKNKPNV